MSITSSVGDPVSVNSSNMIQLRSSVSCLGPWSWQRAVGQAAVVERGRNLVLSKFCKMS